MRRVIQRSVWACALLLAASAIPASGATITLTLAAEHTSGYQRSLFKHWIDADGNGCNTRNEVLIAEAIVKPTITGRCTLSGGKWISAYDGLTIYNKSKLDIDHLVPLAEAWRSGAWAWTATERMNYANDLTEPAALIAVSASTNRSKGDKDPANWLPEKNLCKYIKDWIKVKFKYHLTVDQPESDALTSHFAECNIPNVKFVFASAN